MSIYGSFRSVSTNCLNKKTLTSSQLSFHPPEVPLPYYSPRRRTHKNFTLQAAEETTAMAPISLALVKIEGDAKANDDADTDAITPRNPLNARLDRNIAPPSFSGNLNSSSPLSTNHRTLFRTPTNSFSSQTN
jgi:hypothetical protein